MIATLLALALAQEQAPVFTKFAFTRERVEHVVLADVTMHNVTPRQLDFVRVMAVYYDHDRELRRSDVAQILTVASGAETRFRLVAKQVEKFTRYLVLVEHTQGGWVYEGNDPNAPPVPRKRGPAKLALFSQKAVPPPSFPGVAKLTLVVRNEGESEAFDPTADIAFRDASGREIRRVRVILGDVVKGGHEDTFGVAVAGVGAYAKVDVSLVHLQAEGAAWQEAAPGVKAVEIRRSRLVRLSDGTIRVTGVFQNGMDNSVQNIKAEFTFGPARVTVSVPHVVASGGEWPFEAYVPKGGNLDGASFSLGYDTAGDKPGSDPPGREAVASRGESRKFREVAAVSIPKQAKVEEKKFEIKRPELSVGAPGLAVIDGYYLKNGKYSGDIWFVRLKCIDKDGKPARPTGTVWAVVYDGEKPLRKVQRIIKKQSWQLDANRLNAQSARHNVIAYDRKTQELLVALWRTEGTFMKFSCDVELTVRDAGVWSWKGIKPDSKEIHPTGPHRQEE